MSPVENYDGENGSELDDEGKSVDKRVAGFNSQQILGDDHVSGGGDGQELRQAFYDGDDDSLKKIHAVRMLLVLLLFIAWFVEDGTDHCHKAEERNHRTEGDAPEGENIRIESLFGCRSEHQAESDDDDDEADGYEDQIDRCEGKTGLLVVCVLLFHRTE